MACGKDIAGVDMKSCQSFTVGHIKRQANEVAHRLAKVATHRGFIIGVDEEFFYFYLQSCIPRVPPF